MTERLLKPADVAAKLGCSIGSIYRWAEVGKIPSVRVGSLLRFQPEAIDRWLTENENAQEAAQ